MPVDAPTGAASRRPVATAVDDAALETYRRELTGYCYRMLGSGFEAEDAVQETLVRAWRGGDRFEGRSSLRSWLYRIATNVCLDMLRGPQRRARPMDLGPASSADAALGPQVPAHEWIQPIADARVLPTDGDPAAVAGERESIRLAFVAALQLLPARQRAVLILRDVLRWQAAEVAELLDASVASVNSALQRARATMSAADLLDTSAVVDGDRERALLARYVDAFERYDIDLLVTLLRDDVVQSMPPFALWLRGRSDVGAWFLGQGIGCRGSRLLPAQPGNGRPVFGAYRPAPGGGHLPFSLVVVDTDGRLVTGLHNFLYPELFPEFGLPTSLRSED